MVDSSTHMNNKFLLFLIDGANLIDFHFTIQMISPKFKFWLLRIHVFPIALLVKMVYMWLKSSLIINLSGLGEKKTKLTLEAHGSCYLNCNYFLHYSFWQVVQVVSKSVGDNVLCHLELNSPSLGSQSLSNCNKASLSNTRGFGMLALYLVFLFLIWLTSCSIRRPTSSMFANVVTKKH